MIELAKGHRMNGSELQSAYGPDGVDVTLIRWFLSLTPAERLAALEQHLDDLVQMRNLNRQDAIQGGTADSIAPRR
jgi:hypothetical protein